MENDRVRLKPVIPVPIQGGSLETQVSNLAKRFMDIFIAASFFSEFDDKFFFGFGKTVEVFERVVGGF